MTPWEIGIIGGGPGGLLTAFLLERHATQPVTITIFEASDRLGGKVLTGRFTSRPVAYEAGAAEFYDYTVVGDDPLKDLVQGLGLPIQPIHGGSLLHDGRLLGNLDDLADTFGTETARALGRFYGISRDRLSPREFYEGLLVPGFDDGGSEPSVRKTFAGLLDTIPCATARRYVERFIHSDLATEPARTSARYGLENVLMNDPAYMQLYCIAGGNEQLITAVAAHVSGQVQLDTKATAISREADGRLTVAFEETAGRSHRTFDAVVVALPVEPLRQLHFHGARLGAAMERHFAHFDHPADYLRISLLFDTPFWRGRWDDAYCMLEAFDGCCLYDESSREPTARHGVLGWLLGGAAAETWSRRSDGELVDAAVDSLPPWLRHTAREQLVEGRVHRWQAAVSGLPGGWQSLPHDQRHQPEPAEHPRLFLVGDYLFDSTLNGVHDSAEYVADWIAALMLERSRPTT